jgi:hypothetical protein
MAVDEDKLNAFAGQFVQDLGATVHAGMVVLGHRLGLYRAMAGAGPLSPAELAGRTGTAERYVHEWLAAQAAAGYLAYDPASGRFSLPEEQAFALADPAGPLYLPGAFQLALASLKAESRIAEAFRGGTGVGWHEQDPEVFDGCEMFFAPRLPGQPRPVVDPGPGRCRGQVAGGGAGRRRGLWPWRLDDHHGQGLP